MGVGLARFVFAFPEQIDIHGSLELFRRPGDDLLDRWDGSRLIRTVPRLGCADAPSACQTGNRVRYLPYLSMAASGAQGSIEVIVNEPDRRAVIEALPAMFAAAPAHFRELLEADRKLGALNALYPGLRPVLQHDLFTALVRSISAQQINLRWAATIRARLAQRFGDRHQIGQEFVYSLDAEQIATASPLEIRGLQFTVRKAESIVMLAREFTEGRLSLSVLSALEDEEIVDRLVSLRGIGLWSAEWILCRTLGRPRVVAGDLGVRKAVGRLYLDGGMPSESETRRLTSHWGASASIAQALALHALATGAGR